MKIALAHEMLVKLGGAERVVRSLADMYPESPIFTLLHDAKVTAPWFGGADVRTSSLQKYYRFLGHPKWLLARMPKAVEALDFSDFDAVISSSSAFMHGIKLPAGAKHLCYVHSPMRYVWDYAHEYTRGQSPAMRLAIASMLSPIREWDFGTASRPDALIANSEHVQARIAKYWRRESTVIHPPVDVKRFTPRADGEDFFLIVSALTPFKRLDLAIRTFNKIKRKLIIIGQGAQRRILESLAGPTIQFLGHQEDAVVRDHFERCRAFIFPGEEDFGITPVEAMAAGKPVLAYGVGGVTESVRAGVSGEFFYEQTPEALEDGLARLLAREKDYDAQKIRAIAEGFGEEIFQDKIRQAVAGLR